MHNDLYSRKLFHITAGSVIPVIYLYSGLSKSEAVMLLFPFVFSGLIFEYFRLLNKKFSDFIHKHLRRLFKSDEYSRINSSVTLLLGCFITVLYFDKKTAIASMFILSIADPVACLAGIKLGRLKIGPKTLEGSLAFFLTALIILVFFFSLKTALTGAFLCALTELLIRPPADDNLLLPPVCAFHLMILQVLF